MPEPIPDRAGTGADADPEQVPGPGPDVISDDVAALCDLVAAGVEVDGEVQVTESTWVIYGRTSYDGEIVVGEYHDATEAIEVFRAVSGPGTGPDADPDPGPDAPLA
jgi:hypothetical protein